MATSSPSTLASPVSPTSPSRPSRLRGLSYLRNLHSSRDSTSPTTTSRPFPLTRATSYPSPTVSPTGSRNNNSGLQSPATRPTQTLQRSTTTTQAPPSSQLQEVPGGTSGWLPPAGGASAALTENTGAAERDAMPRQRAGTASREAGSDISEMNGGSDPQLQYGSASAGAGTTANATEKPTIRFSQHQDVRAPRPSLVFSPMGRTLPTGKEVVRVGRYSERETQPNQPANLQTAAAVGFKSKVVSRRHCEFWYADGVWYIKDAKSSSGTFLNHVRLSSPGTESKPYAVKDGDIVQLGIDFKGGEEMIFRCVKIRIELNKGWQTTLNNFNLTSHKQLRSMAKQNQSSSGGGSSQDCSICLGAIAPCQSLFVAPCSHTWHYKCVRRIINGPHYPTFMCPNCRAVADLEADFDEPIDDSQWEKFEEDAVAEAVAAPATTEQAEEVAAAPELSTSEIEAAVGNLDIADPAEATTTERSNSTVAPIPIAASARVVSRKRGDTSATIGNDTEQDDLRDVRTPSPSEQAALLQASADGPMTPRNDAGPFIFDGSAGRLPISVTRVAALDDIANGGDSYSQDSTTADSS